MVFTVFTMVVMVPINIMGILDEKENKKLRFAHLIFHLLLFTLYIAYFIIN